MSGSATPNRGCPEAACNSSEEMRFGSLPMHGGLLVPQLRDRCHRVRTTAEALTWPRSGRSFRAKRALLHCFRAAGLPPADEHPRVAPGQLRVHVRVLRYVFPVATAVSG